MSSSHLLSRRDCLRSVAVVTLPVGSRLTAAQKTSTAVSKVHAKSVAAIITAYAPGLQADVLIGKILEGWRQDGGVGPALRLASMYVEQFPANDLARPMARKHDVPIFATTEEAITVGGNRIAVDDVISIGEHGNYPWNEKEQHLYPRRRFFQAICIVRSTIRTLRPRLWPLGRGEFESLPSSRPSQSRRFSPGVAGRQVPRDGDQNSLIRPNP